MKKKKNSYKKKYELAPDISGKYGASMFNPTVQPDKKTKKGVPVPCEENVEYSKEYEENAQL